MVSPSGFFIFTPWQQFSLKSSNREIPAYIVAEDENYIAFLDIMPLAKGHVLVVPKVEVDYIFDLEDEVLAGLHVFSKKVAQAMDKNHQMHQKLGWLLSDWRSLTCMCI